ncbi:MAG: hypothetical protein MUF41_07550 [Sphingopyxis sp.]|nr:hypothetical protein [Sphingopyxis sp.]
MTRWQEWLAAPWAGEVAMLALSLVAVLVVARAVRWLGLGSDYQRIADAAHAIRLAEEAECGFGGVEADVDTAGYAAIVRNAAGGMMLVRSHGNHFAARRLYPGVAARLDRERLIVDCGDARFGAVALDLGKRAPVVASSFRRLV